MNLKKQTLVLALAVITALSITVSIVSSHNIPDNTRRRCQTTTKGRS